MLSCLVVAKNGSATTAVSKASQRPEATDYDTVTKRRLSSPLPVELPEVFITGGPHEIAPEAIFVTDSKCVYDAAGNNQPCDDQRSVSEMPVFLELVKRTAGRYDGLHNYNLADVLTKFRGAHADPLMSLMRDSSYVLRKEDTESADRAKQQQEMVFSTRLKRTAPVNHLSDVSKV